MEEVPQSLQDTLVKSPTVETDYVLAPVRVTPFDVQTMGAAVNEMFADPAAAQWVEPLSQDSLKAISEGMYGPRGFGVMSTEQPDKCVGFIYFSPVGFGEDVSVLKGNITVRSEILRAREVTFVKAPDAPKGAMSFALQQACGEMMQGSGAKQDAQTIVLAYVDDKNDRSQKFLENNGFRKCGSSLKLDHEGDQVFVLS